MLEEKSGHIIKGLLKNHDHVIYASKPDRAVAFETDLLNEEEWQSQLPF
jgi:hypothetical protein